ncbi:MAG: sigma-70 family RNA polymerase sigma factor [Planctomycetes bacterium]|nr:sigma-70 family RNA polymerase sigma factor [Planctomycetota bacterium]MCB9903258.1 sigma-70 family RNA polymerase sigma factor [Planctomycetota bacterium]
MDLRLELWGRLKTMGTPVSDEQLIAEARAGDRAAYDALARRHFQRVHALLFRLVGNHEDAEDLTQECFVKAHRSLGWYRSECSFATWLYRIAVHLSRDHYRKRSRRGKVASLSELQEAQNGPPSPRCGPRELAVQHEFEGILRDALDTLPHRLRAALVLRTLEGLEYDEIAEVLGIQPGTARVHVMKARRQLARLLSSWTDGGAS